jgi:hypothetical protein
MAGRELASDETSGIGSWEIGLALFAEACTRVEKIRLLGFGEVDDSENSR